VIMLVALSILKPALSQGAADFGNVALALNFDWIYLAAYPLIYRWDPLKLWMLVGGFTVLFFVAPWLPPKRRSRDVAAHLTLHPGNRNVAVREGETVLEAGLHQGVPMPFECRNGGCGVCKCTLQNGSIAYSQYQKNALTNQERAVGKFLACTSTPSTDVEIEYEEGAATREQANAYAARVQKMMRAAHDVMIVILKLPEGQTIEFGAGQFTNLILADGDRRAYSFATAPRKSDQIELHIRLVPGGRFTTHVFYEMHEDEVLHFEGPLGYSAIANGKKPLIFVAGATGFAPAKSMLEYAFEQGYKRKMMLYWGTRKRRDLYVAELPERWQREHSNFRFVPVLSEPAVEDDWKGRTGLVHEAILSDFPNLSGYEFYACGSVKMVEAARPAFFPHTACAKTRVSPTPSSRSWAMLCRPRPRDKASAGSHSRRRGLAVDEIDRPAYLISAQHAGKTRHLPKALDAPSMTTSSRQGTSLRQNPLDQLLDVAVAHLFFRVWRHRHRAVGTGSAITHFLH